MPELIVSDFARSFKIYTQVIDFDKFYEYFKEDLAFLQCQRPSWNQSQNIPSLPRRRKSNLNDSEMVMPSWA
jgi:hypothetical protein